MRSHAVESQWLTFEVHAVRLDGEELYTKPEPVYHQMGMPIPKEYEVNPGDEILVNMTITYELIDINGEFVKEGEWDTNQRS